jgi:hypothetical protein
MKREELDKVEKAKKDLFLSISEALKIDTFVDWLSDVNHGKFRRLVLSYFLFSILIIFILTNL